jgi:lipoprotein-releasing system permease protein
LNFLFAWRYFKARKSTQAINIIAWVSVTAITLITAAFIVLMSVFNGFEGLVKSLYSSFYSELRVVPDSGTVMRLSPAVLQQLKTLPEIAACAGVIEEKALVQNADLQTIVFVKGVDDSYPLVSGVAGKMVRGKYYTGTADQPALVLGGGIENALAVDVEKSIYPMTLYLFRKGVPVNSMDPYQSFATEQIAGAGTFFIQQDIDSKYAITNLNFIRRMLGLDSTQYGSLEISARSPEQVNALKQRIEALLGTGFRVETRFEQNKSLYSVMTLEKWAIYGILTLMLGVAAFTMIGALTMLVMEKQKDIQVLKAMGSSARRIQQIFLTEGFLLGAVGGIAGILLGVLICWAQVTFKIVPIQGGTFLIDYYPVEIRALDFTLIVITVLAVALLASWIPSRKAAREAIELKS